MCGGAPLPRKSCCPQPCCPQPCCPPSSCCSPCCPPLNSCCGPCGSTCIQPCLNYGLPQLCPDAPCPRKGRREKRWPQCNFLKPCIDTRIYRDGEHLCISYAGHIPGEQFIHGRNLPTTTTFAKRRLCSFTPYEYVDPDGCCSFP